MTTLHWLRKKGVTKKSIRPRWGSKSLKPPLPCQGRGGNCCSLPYDQACTQLLSDVMRSKLFLAHLILTLSWCLKKRIRSRSESLHRHTITSSASSKPPFWQWLGLGETSHVSHLSTEVQHYPWCNLHWAAQAVWDRCELSTPRCDSKTAEPARSRRRRVQPFLPLFWRSGNNQACFPGLTWKPTHEGETHSERTARWVRTQSCSRSSSLLPNSIGNKSPTTSRVAPWADPKRYPSLITGTAPFENEKPHWTEEVCEGP